jgi:small subunit ribosomal protein S16
LVKLRLTRLGKNKQPFYRIVVADVKTGQQGSALDLVGTYDPLHARVAIDEEAALNWLNRGAQMTGTVEALFRSQGLLARWKGIEGKVRPDALSKAKPARRRKLAAAVAVPGGDQGAAEAAPATQG